MNKTLLASSILLAGSAIASENAQSDDIENIVITAHNFAQPIEQTLATVGLITRNEIERSNIRDLPTLLQSLAGVELVRNGGFGQKSDAFIRGATSKHSLVLIDGVRVGDANEGAKAIASVPVNAIEKIEVIRGARAAVYGSEAVAGVINIITRKVSQSEISLTGGSNSYQNAQGNFSLVKENFSVNVNAGFEKTDGYDVTEKQVLDPTHKDADDDGYENKNIGVRAKLKTSVGDFTLISQHNQGFAQYDNAWGSDEGEFENYVNHISWQKQHDTFSHELNLSNTQDRNQQTGSVEGDNYQTNRNEAKYQLQYNANEELTWSGGLNWYEESVDKTHVGGNALNKTERDNFAIYAGGYYSGESFIFNATLRSDDYEQYGAENTYNLSLGYKVTDTITLRLTQGTAFRAPTFGNLYTPEGEWRRPNPDLQPEEGKNKELGALIQFDNGSVDIAVFDNNIDNMIASSLVDGKYTNINIDKAQMKGTEVTAKFSLLSIQHQLNATYLDAKDKKTGDTLVRRPDRSVNWTATKQWDNFDLSVSMNYRSERPTIAWFNSVLPSFTIWNLSGNYYISDEIKLFARVDNLSDKRYASAAFDKDEFGKLYYYKTPERQIFAGVSYQF